MDVRCRACGERGEVADALGVVGRGVLGGAVLD